MNHKERDTGCVDCAKLKVLLWEAEENTEHFQKALNSQQSENNSLLMENKQLREQSNNLTRQMAKTLEFNGTLENTNDMFSNCKLAKDFQHLYSIEWIKLSEWCQDAIPLNEIERIEFLTKIMQCCYKQCQAIAKKQIHDFLFLGGDGKSDTDMKDVLSELYALRRVAGQKEVQQKIVQQQVWQQVWQGILKEFNDNPKFKHVSENSKEASVKLREFFETFTNMCWLITISYPQLVLNFDVVDQQYETIKEHFMQFSTQEKMMYKKENEGKVAFIVWPSLELKDETGILAKGDVITSPKNPVNN